MNAAQILQLIQALLPVGEDIASIFIHNPNSQHKLSVVVGDVNTIAGVSAQLPNLQPTNPAPAK